MSAENGIGTAGRLHAVEEPPKPETGQRWGWPKGRVPFAHIKNSPENGPKQRNWRGILSTIGEIAGIAGISGGVWEIYPPAGLITAGIGVLALAVVSGLPE